MDAKSTKLKITNICDNCYGRIPPLSRPTHSTCCSTVYCHLNCQEIALASYHKVLCGQNFDWLYQEGAKKPGHLGLNGPMWLRILAACIQSDCHPLDHPSIANLSPLYDDYSRLWSLSNNIVTPIKILRQSGIDVYSDMRYDTWVLQTVWARVINNQQGDLDEREWHLRGINQFYSFFNHSCEPNTGWSTPASATCVNGMTKVMFAQRDIRKGEELCVTYLSEMRLRQSKTERSRMLCSHWERGFQCWPDWYRCPKTIWDAQHWVLWTLNCFSMRCPHRCDDIILDNERKELGSAGGCICNRNSLLSFQRKT